MFRTTIVNLFHIRCLSSFNGSIFVVPVFVMKKCRRKKTLSDTMAKNCNGGNTFPLDIWYLIAKYIRPEDVITFSTICRDAWCVVNTPSFWLNLYKRSVHQRQHWQIYSVWRGRRAKVPSPQWLSPRINSFYIHQNVYIHLKQFS